VEASTRYRYAKTSSWNLKKAPKSNGRIKEKKKTKTWEVSKGFAYHEAMLLVGFA